MTTFLFWNLKRKPRQKLVANLALQHKVDVLMLAECTIPPDVLQSTLNQTSTLYDYAPGIGCKKIEIFTRFSNQFIAPTYETERLTVRHLQVPGETDILLSVIHFSSRTHWSVSSQSAESSVVSNLIQDEEKRIGHTRTILVGDFNMHPFDVGVVNANGLHGVMSRRIAQQETRTVQGRKYPFFYNPMWNLLGDATSDTPGTYYTRRAEHTAYFWHMFDQVLIRPALLDAFDNADLKILCSDRKTSFLSRGGFPNDQVASDHLPILFKLKL